MLSAEDFTATDKIAFFTVTFDDVLPAATDEIVYYSAQDYCVN